MRSDKDYMRRCFELALLGKGKVSPNPMVGAVLVHNGRIIGEGYHRQYGAAHAEVNALTAVAEADRELIAHSTLYVSLEPCCFSGKTPPCTLLILQHQIPRVVISCLDDTPEVAGKGVAQLRTAGVDVISGLLEEEGRELSRPRSVFVKEKRPYILLKLAQSRNGIMAALEDRQVWISNPYARRLAHKWRGEVDAILVGTNTARIDNPQLNVRNYFGDAPLRIVLDRKLTLPPNLHLFDGSTPTLVITEEATHPDWKKVAFVQLTFTENLLPELLRQLHGKGIGVLMVEGGRQLLSSFLNAGLWDEAMTFVGATDIKDGIPAPVIPASPEAIYPLNDNQLLVYKNRPTLVKNSLK